jgi:hypothetical protein
LIDAKLLEAIQILALKSVEIPDHEDVYNKICRWYSKEFSTPLSAVEDLDPVHVLRNFFESRYEAIRDNGEKGDAEFQKIKQDLLYPEEVQKAKNETDDWVRRLEAEVRAEEDRKKNKANKALEEVGQKLGKTLADEVAKTVEELNLSSIPDEFKLPDSGSMGE